MLDSISNIFSLPTVSKQKYKSQPSFQQALRRGNCRRSQ
jgi:hypothetical protein